VPAPIPGSRSGSANAALGIGAVLGCLVVVYASFPYGPGVSQLGLHYIAAAEGLRTGAGMVMTRGGPFTWWPPLLPALLAIVRSLGLGYPEAALAINLASHGAILYLASKLVLRLTGSFALAAANLALLLTSPRLVQRAADVSSEPLFVALVLGCVCALVAYCDRPTLTRLAWVAGLAALASLQRYAGVFLVAAILPVVAIHPVSVPRRVRWARATGVVALAVLPVLLWCWRNWILEGTLTGPRYPSSRGLGLNVLWTGLSLQSFLVGETEVPEPLSTGILSLALFLVGLAVFRVFQRRSEGERGALAAYFAFPAAYVVLLPIQSSLVQIDLLGDRLYLPVFPFLCGAACLGCLEVRRLLAEAPLAWRRSAFVLLLVFFGTRVSIAAAETWSSAEVSRSEGNRGFGSRRWARSELVLWLRDHPPEGKIYSNAPEFVLFATGRLAVLVDGESLARSVTDADLQDHVIWASVRAASSPLPEISLRDRRLEELVRASEGAVYRIESIP